jgi:EthD domain
MPGVQRPKYQAAMIKVVTTLKKKPGLSTEEFRNYYESHHRLIGEKYLKDYAARYLRRYIDPLPNAEGKISNPNFDVLLEIWFEDESALQACNLKLNEADVAREIILDEEKLFDRSQKFTYLVTECESNLESA